MNRHEIKKRLHAALEELAHIEQERWSHWQRYLHSKGKRMNDGSMVIPSDLVKHWEKQIATDYRSLSEREKESDREQVRNYFPILIRALSAERN